MRIKRDYLAAIKRFLSWFSSRFKPLTVHTEAIIIDSVWEEIKKRAKKRDVLKWYIMTPANADYFRSEFNFNMPSKKLSEIMKKRKAAWLKEDFPE